MDRYRNNEVNEIHKNIISRKIKKERIKINNLNDFMDALKKEGYKINESNEEEFKAEIAKDFGVDKGIIESLYTSIRKEDITYKVIDIKDLFDYIEKIIQFESEHNKLCKKIAKIKKIIIHRIEYEREPSVQDNVEDITKIIDKISNEISQRISDYGKIKIRELEKELDKEYLYAKDIELLKKIVLLRKEPAKETYDPKNRIKTISMDIPEKINYDFIIHKKGTVEYHEYLINNIPRIQRLIRNINYYIKEDANEKTTFIIDQSKTLQDTINMAVAIYDDKEFKAISGSNEIANYCYALPLDMTAFKSSKVNKLGKLGIGYNRVNDSEKKIFEEIHKQIEEKVLRNEGNLILYSKWEPCPSCYFVIDQFCKKHPHIKVQVRYIKKYGE